MFISWDFCIKILFCNHDFSPLNTFMWKGKDPGGPKTYGSYGSGQMRFRNTGYRSILHSYCCGQSYNSFNILQKPWFYIPLSLCWSRNHPGDRRRHHPANNHHRHRHRLTDPTHHHPHNHHHHRRCPCRLCFVLVHHPPMWRRLHRRQPLCWPLRQSPEYPARPRRSLARPGTTKHGVAWPLFGLCLLRIWWWPFPFLSDCCHPLKNQISIFKNLFKANWW